MTEAEARKIAEDSFNREGIKIGDMVREDASYFTFECTQGLHILHISVFKEQKVAAVCPT